MIPIRDTIPSRHPPVMMWILIAVNIAVFLFETMLTPGQLKALFFWLGIVPARYTHPGWAQVLGLSIDNYWPFLTSIFLHGSWLHLIGNLWVLWIFGDNVEDRMGPLRFLLFYLLCGIVAGVTHAIFSPHSTVPTVGASGAIAGVLGAYFLLYPRARVIVLVPVFFWPLFFDLPAVVFLAIWFAIQVFSGTAALLAPANVGGIAWWAHAGGFIAGMLLHRLFLARSPCHGFHGGEGCFEIGWHDD